MASPGTDGEIGKMTRTEILVSPEYFSPLKVGPILEIFIGEGRKEVNVCDGRSFHIFFLMVLARFLLCFFMVLAQFLLCSFIVITLFLHSF